VRARAQADPNPFLGEHGPPQILDEIQHAPGLLPFIKDLIDRDRRPGQWLLSGSQSLSLMRGVSQTLAGRVAVLTLDPLSVSEVTRHPSAPAIPDLIECVWGGAPAVAESPNLAPDLGDWLLRGGFPEVALDPAVDRELWFASYVQTYLERDVRDLLQVGDLAAFGRFVALVAARTGTLLNMTDLGRDAGVTGPTVKRWLSVLEASQVIPGRPCCTGRAWERSRRPPSWRSGSRRSARRGRRSRCSTGAPARDSKST
jgi:predicted AAA+ superfamily ATPase